VRQSGARDNKLILLVRSWRKVEQEKIEHQSIFEGGQSGNHSPPSLYTPPSMFCWVKKEEKNKNKDSPEPPKLSLF
jgi:hypothetical protein